MIRKVKRLVEVIHCDCCKHTTDTMKDEDSSCESKFGEMDEFDSCIICGCDICPCCAADKPEDSGGMVWGSEVAFICKKCWEKGYDFFQGDNEDAVVSIYKNGRYNRTATKKYREAFE